MAKKFPRNIEKAAAKVDEYARGMVTGGTLFEENVHAATGFVNKTSTDEIKTLIREAGFRPAQRTTLYEILEIF